MRILAHQKIVDVAREHSAAHQVNIRFALVRRRMGPADDAARRLDIIVHHLREARIWAEQHHLKEGRRDARRPVPLVAGAAKKGHASIGMLDGAAHGLDASCTLRLEADPAAIYLPQQRLHEDDRAGRVQCGWQGAGARKSHNTDFMPRTMAQDSAEWPWTSNPPAKFTPTQPTQ